MERQQAVKPVLSLPVRLRADIRATGKGVGIAMIDSDFVRHPDLMKPVNRITRYVDAVQGAESDAPPAKANKARQWHGTMTACTAAGNGYLSQGVYTSLAPNATLTLIRTMNDHGRVTTDTIVEALEYVGDHAEELQIRVVNISVYADEVDQTLDHPVNDAVDRLVRNGICVISAVGNNPNVPIRPPAATPSGIAVGGLNDNNSLRSDDDTMYPSTFGRTTLGVQKPDVIAPAIYLPAPILLGTPQRKEAAALCAMDAMDDDMLLACAPSLMPHTQLPVSVWTSRSLSELRAAIRTRIATEQICGPFYKMVDGTSFSSPIVASIVAQMLELDPTLTPADVKQLLIDHARPLEGVPAMNQGAGVVHQTDTLAAVRRGASVSA